MLDSPIVREDGHADRRQVPPRGVVAAGGQGQRGGAIGGDFAYVYLAVSSFVDVTSKTNNVGDWAKYELSFMVPVEWQRLVNGSGRWKASVSSPPSPWWTTAWRHLALRSSGDRGASRANFVRPESIWLAEGEADANGEADDAAGRCRGDPGAWRRSESENPAADRDRRGDDDVWPGGPVASATPFEWAETLALELGTKKGVKAAFPEKCKVARALALEVLGNRYPSPSTR